MTEHRTGDPLPRLVYLTSLALQQHADRLLAPCNVTLEQFHPLKLLLLAGGELPQRLLAEQSGKSAANMTRILDRLVKKGLVRRIPDPHDRRAFVVALTPEGRGLVDKVVRLFDSYLDRVMAGISPADEEVCRRVLHRLTENLANLEPSVAIPHPCARREP